MSSVKSDLRENLCATFQARHSMDMDLGNECEECKTCVKHEMQLILCTKYDTQVYTVNAT